MTRTIKIAKGLSAFILLAVLLIAVPWALWHYVGWPLPHGLPSWSQFTTALNQHGIPDQVLLKGRLQPGRMFLVDLEQGRIIGDDELKEKIAAEHPYATWLRCSKRRAIMRARSRSSSGRWPSPKTRSVSATLSTPGL